jgi:dTMP kinase
LARLDEGWSGSDAASGAPMTVRARGRFITLEGGEGAGKSVQAKRLEERLAGLGLAVVRTREPGGSPGAEALREAILSGFAAEFGPTGQALLFAAARVDHLDKTILPALASGAWVVSDRFADSTRAYQGAAGNLPPEFIDSLERLTVGANQPDLTLILDLDPEVGLKRAAKRRQGRGPADRFESEGLPFHKTLRRAFLDIAAAEPLRCAIIDADRSEDDVAATIWSTVETRLNPMGAVKASHA